MVDTIHSGNDCWRKRRVARWTPALVLCLLCLPHALVAQDADDSITVNPYGTGLGAQILLTNSGFGLGGYYQRATSPALSVTAELALSTGKDEREVAFFNRFGQKDIPNKANYLLMVSFQAGVQRRLFRDTIEDNFRPFLQFSFGPTLGWEYPYFDDCNGNQRYDANVACDADGVVDDSERIYDSLSSLGRGHARFGFGGNISIGSYFGLSETLSQGVRFGYTFTYFTDGIQLLEPDIKAAQHFFGTPSITIIFGRLF